MQTGARFGPTEQSRNPDLAPPRPAGALTCIRRGARKSPSIRPQDFAWRSVPRPACRGPHLYPKVRPEIAFDPSRRFCLAFRPESVGGWGCVQTDTTGRSVPRPAGALTCIRWCARKWPLIRPAGFARRSVPPSSHSGNFPVCSRKHVAPARKKIPAPPPNSINSTACYGDLMDDHSFINSINSTLSLSREGSPSSPHTALAGALCS